MNKIKIKKKKEWSLILGLSHWMAHTLSSGLGEATAAGILDRKEGTHISSIW
jgi:hypothetical protein